MVGATYAVARNLIFKYSDLVFLQNRKVATFDELYISKRDEEATFLFGFT